jgi:hypothetical protein
MTRCTACRRLTRTPKPAPAGHVVLFVDRAVVLPAGAPVCWRCPVMPRPTAPPPMLTQGQVELLGQLLRRGTPSRGEERELVARALEAA